MSTDMYGVRVVACDPDQLRVRLRVFVVYYETSARRHFPLPGEEPGVFLHFLWESGGGYQDDPADPGAPPVQALDLDRILDYEWMDTNARRYVTHVERAATLNYPPTEGDWDHLHDFHHERDGAWQDEHLLVQAEYELRVTDRTWIEHLSPGSAWASAAFPMNGDTWTPQDAPHIPDLATPSITLRPFETATGNSEDDHVQWLTFSDDGTYLALCSDQARVWVYDTADWSQVAHAHAHAGDWILPLLMWLPGAHTLVVKDYFSGADQEEETQWAYDVDQRTEVQVPFLRGRLVSHNGTYRISPNGGREGGYDLHGAEREPYRRISHTGGESDPIQYADFSADSSRLFLGSQRNLYVVDPATGDVLAKVENATKRLGTLAANPDGSYLATSGSSRKGYLKFGGKHPHELCVWRMADRRIVLGHQLRTYVEALAWSPDGRRLAAALEPTGDGFHSGRTEVAVFAMGPGGTDELGGGA